ncbi:MAG TPA: carbon monoxide dehydrogenase subunit G [Chloroflexota bacterium]|jgi:carbon monoxide dehydrogenase subunit G
MKVAGSYHFPAPPEQVWRLLHDPEALAAAIPGCQKLEPLADGRYAATLSIGVAAFKGAYKGTVAIANERPPQSYDLRVEGSGRPGFVNGVGHIRLEPDAAATPGTQVTVDGDAQVGGPVLSVGSRLVVPTARRLMNQFFEAMQRRLEGEPAPQVGLDLGRGRQD